MDTIAPHIAEWFAKRTVSEKTLKDFSVSWNGTHIVIPVFDPSGAHIFNKYRRDPRKDDGPKYQYDKGATSALYGAEHLRPGYEVVVCEGELDALALYSHGFMAVSSTGGAGTFDPRWADLLKDRDVIILYDRDLPGYKGALNVQSIIPWARVAVLPNRNGIKDVTDFFMNGGTEEELKKIFATSYRYPMEEYPIPEKKTEQKALKQKYIDRIDWAFKQRGLIGMGDASFFDFYIRYHQELVEDVQKEIKRKKFKKSADRERSVQAAKATDMRQFVKFDRQGFAVCPFHNEKTPSMHYIVKSNKVYCFGACQKSYDVIDIVMQQRNINFSEAVEQLCKGV